MSLNKAIMDVRVEDRTQRCPIFVLPNSVNRKSKLLYIVLKTNVIR